MAKVCGENKSLTIEFVSTMSNQEQKSKKYQIFEQSLEINSWK